MRGPEVNRMIMRDQGAVAEFRRAEKMAEARRSTKFGAAIMQQIKPQLEEPDEDDEPVELPLRYTKAPILQPLLAFPLRQWPNVPTKNSSSTFVNLRLSQEDRRIDIFAVSKAVAMIRISSIESVTRVSAQDVFLNGCACLLAFLTEENANEVEALLRACLGSPTFSLSQGMTVINEGHLSMKKSALVWTGRYAKLVKGRFLLYPESDTKLPSEVLPVSKVCFVRAQGDRILEIKFTHSGFALMFRADSRTDRNQWVSAFAAEKKESFPISDLFAEMSLRRPYSPILLDRPMSLPALEDNHYIISSYPGQLRVENAEANPLPEFLDDSDSDEGFTFPAKRQAPLPPPAARENTRKRGGSSQSMGSNDLMRIVKDVKPKAPVTPEKVIPPPVRSQPKSPTGPDRELAEFSRVSSFSQFGGREESKARISTCHSSFKFNETRYKGGAQPLDASKAQLCTELAAHSLRWSFAPLEAPCPMIAAVQTTTPGTSVDVIVIPELRTLLARSSVQRAILRIITVGTQEQSWFVAESFHGGDEVKTSLLEVAPAQDVADSKQRLSVLKSRYSRHSNNITVSGWEGNTKAEAMALSAYALADAGVLVPSGRNASMSRKLSDIPPPPDSPSSSMMPPPSPSLSRMSYHGNSESHFELEDLALPPTPLHSNERKHSSAQAFAGFSFHEATAHSTTATTAESSPSSVISFLSSSSSSSPEYSPHAPLLAGVTMTSSAPPSTRANVPPPPPPSSSSSSSTTTTTTTTTAASTAFASSMPSSPSYSYSNAQPVTTNISPPLVTATATTASTAMSTKPSSYSYSSAFSGQQQPPPPQQQQPQPQQQQQHQKNNLPTSSSSGFLPSVSPLLLSPHSYVEPPFQKSIQLRMWTDDDSHDLESFLLVPERHLMFRSRMLCLHEEISEVCDTDPALGNAVWSSRVLRLFAHRMSIHKSLKEQLPELVLPLGCKKGKFAAEGSLTIKIVAHRKLWIRSPNKEVHDQWLKAFAMERVLSQGVLASSLTVESLTSDEVQQPKTPDPLIALKLKHLTRSHLNKQDNLEQRPSANLFTEEIGPQQQIQQLGGARTRAASPSPFQNGDDDDVVVTLEQAFVDPFILALYEKFAKECFEAENIAYILEVRKFEDLMDIAAVVWRPDNEANTQAKAQEIYTMFVREGSELELNIIHTLRQDLRHAFEAKMSQGEDVPLSRGMFEAVTTEILRLMRTNSWIRFRNSEYWAKVVDHVLEEGGQAHMGPLIPPFAGEFDSQQSFFGSCRRLGQHPVCFMSPVWPYEQWLRESAAEFYHWRGEKTQKLDDLVKAHTSTFDGCVALLKGAKLVLVDPKEEAVITDTKIGFSYPGFVSEVVEVGSISVVSVWQLIADASDLSFQLHDWDAALASPSVGKLLMQTSPDVSDLYDKGPVGVKEAKALMSAAQLEVLHNVCLAAFIHTKGGARALDTEERSELRWSSLLETRGDANRDHLEEWDDFVYYVKPKWFFMIEMVRANDPYHNVLLGPSEFLLCIVVLLNLRLASVVNLKSYLTVWLAEHKKKAGTSRYQAAMELMEGITQEERELVRVLVQLPNFATLTGTAVLRAFPLDVYTAAPPPPVVTRSRTQTTGAMKDRGSAAAAGWGYGKKTEEGSISPPTSPPLGPAPVPQSIPSMKPGFRLPRPPLTTYPQNPFSMTAPSSSTSTTTTNPIGSNGSNMAPPAHTVSHAARASIFAFFPSLKSLMSTHAIPPPATVLKTQVAEEAAAAALKRSPALIDDLSQHRNDEKQQQQPPPQQQQPSQQPQQQPAMGSPVRKSSPSGRRYSATIANAKPKQPPPPVPKQAHKHTISGTSASASLPPMPLPSASTTVVTPVVTPIVTPVVTPVAPVMASSVDSLPACITEAVAMAGSLPVLEADTPRSRARSTNLKTPSKAAPTRRNTVLIPETIEEGPPRSAKADERRSLEEAHLKKAPARLPPPPPHTAGATTTPVLLNASVDRTSSSGDKSDRGSTSSTGSDGRQTPKAPTKQAPPAPPRPTSPGPNKR